MSHQGTDGFADGIVSGLIIGTLCGVLFLSNVVIQLLVRVYFKYREHRLMLGIAATWMISVLAAVVIASIPALTTTGVFLGLASTAACLIAAAIAEVVLDQRAQSLNMRDEEHLSDHLRRWWT